MFPKPHAAALIALGVAVIAHAGMLAGWVHSQGAAPRRPPLVPAMQTRMLSWPGQPAPTPAPLDQTRRQQAQGQAQRAAPTVAEEAAGSDHGEPKSHFWPSSDLDFRAWPRQAPDTAPLTGITWPATHPVRLRLSITAQGEVVDVTPLDDEPLPGDVLDALAAMFKATPFMPARRQGQDVASTQDIEVGL